MEKIKLIPCDLCASEHSTYDFFEAKKADFFVVGFEFRTTHIDDEGNEVAEPTSTQYELLSVGHYRDGGIALVLHGQMLYEYGKNCFITGYWAFEIEKE